MANNRRVLNVGCGSETYGTDYIDFYPSRKDVKECDVDRERFPYPGGVFDEVYSRNLLEHVSNPFHVLSEMKRILKKGGKLVIITDNAGFILYHVPLFEHIFAQHNTNKYRYGKKDRHYFIFTQLHVRNLLHKVGFSQVSVEFYFRNVNKGFNFVKIAAKMVKGTPFESMICPFLTVVAYKK